MLTASRAEMILELENLGLSDWVYGPKPPKFLHFLKMASSNSDSLEPAETYQVRHHVLQNTNVDKFSPHATVHSCMIKM